MLMNLKKVLVVAIVTLVYSFPLPAQNRNVTGKILDSSSKPIPGAAIIQDGTKNGITSDENGQFVISLPRKAVTIEVSCLGYTSQKKAIGIDQNSIVVILQEDLLSLEETVVVGYGTQKKVNLTGSVQSVTAEEITKRNASNVSNALQGIVPGLSAVQASGQPGEDGATLRVRGTGSLNSSSSPLVLIDGIVGDINRIDMNTIESISVLKDAASASIYGSRASNGVILVTTKRGSTGKPKVTYSGYIGTNKPTNIPKPASALEYMEATNKARANNNQDPMFSDEVINIYKTQGADNYNYYDTNWRDLLINDKALVHNHSVSISGGSESVRFFADAGYYYQDGIIDNNDYSNMTLRINTDADLTKWLRVGVDVNIRKSYERNPNSQNSAVSLISSVIGFIPTTQAICNDGTWGDGMNGYNPIAIVKDGGYSKTRGPELGIKPYITISPIDGLDILASYSHRKVESITNNFTNTYDTYEKDVFKTTWPASGKQKTEGYSRTFYNQMNLQASYEKALGDHYFKVLGGMQTEELLYHAFSTGRYGYNYDGFTEINNGDVSTAYNSGSSDEWAMLSYLGRLNYNYKGKYLLELNGRWDASSRFKKGNRWGFFPSISSGWRISEEKFFEPLRSAINNLKLRASYGTLGNQDIGGYYPYAATVDVNSSYTYYFNKELVTGVAQGSVSNPHISWEKSHQFDLGIDLGMLASRLDISFDYYIKNVTDMLQRFSIPYFVGLSSAYQNAGKMRNNGWEIQLTWRDSIGSDFNYSVTGILQDVKNKIVDLYGNEYISSTSITTKGHPINSWYGYKSDGYFQSREEIDAYPVYNGNKDNYKPGYIKYLDISGPDGKPDGVITDKDRTIIGNPQPRYEFSLNLTADWKGFDFSMFFQGVGKKDILYTGSMARPFYVGASILKCQLDNWSENNRNAKFPLLLIDGNRNNPNNITSDFWVKSGAYLRLKNIILGYTLPTRITDRCGIDKARLYISGQNIFTISNAYDGYDPENSVNGGAFYPIMKTFTFGVNLTF